MSPERLDEIHVAPIDWNEPRETEGLLAVLDAYASEEVGGGRSLPLDVRQRLVPALRAQSNAVVLLAFVESEVAGALTAFLGFSTFAARPLLNVHDLAVLPRFRRRGIARGLMTAAEAHARAAGCVKLTLEVLESNASARRLYRELGYGDFQLAEDPLRTLFLSKALVRKEPA